MRFMLYIVCKTLRLSVFNKENYLLTYVEADNFTVPRYVCQYLGDCGLAVWSRLAKLLYVETGQ